MGDTLTRRSFMKAAGLVAAGTAMGGALAACSNTQQAEGPEPKQAEVGQNLAVDEDVELVEEEEFYCTCSWSCSFCQYHIYTRNGNVAHMLPLPDFDYRTCLKGRSRIQRTYSEERIRYPMRRVDGTPRGGGEWEQISWDEAVKEIVDQCLRPLAN